MFAWAELQMSNCDTLSIAWRIAEGKLYGDPLQGPVQCVVVSCISVGAQLLRAATRPAKPAASVQGMEIVFVSSDRGEEAFNDYFAEMPWKALPFADRERKEALSTKFKVQGIPTFVILGTDGSIITKDGMLWDVSWDVWCAMGLSTGIPVQAVQGPSPPPPLVPQEATSPTTTRTPLRIDTPPPPRYAPATTAASPPTTATTTAAEHLHPHNNNIGQPRTAQGCPE